VRLAFVDGGREPLTGVGQLRLEVRDPAAGRELQLEPLLVGTGGDDLGRGPAGPPFVTTGSIEAGRQVRQAQRDLGMERRELGEPPFGGGEAARQVVAVDLPGEQRFRARQESTGGLGR